MGDPYGYQGYPPAGYPGNRQSYNPDDLPHHPAPQAHQELPAAIPPQPAYPYGPQSYGVPPQAQQHPQPVYQQQAPYPPQQYQYPPAGYPPQGGMYPPAGYPPQQFHDAYPPPTSPHGPHMGYPPGPGVSPDPPRPPPPFIYSSGQNAGNPSYPDATKDALDLWRALDKLMVDKPPVIRILAHRQSYQINEIRRVFPDVSTGRKLIETIDKKTSLVNKTNNFTVTLHALALGQHESEAWWVYRSVKGMGTKDDILTEAIFGRTQRELFDMKNAYGIYGESLEKAVSDDLSFDTKRLFEFGYSGRRPDDWVERANPHKVGEDVQRIRKAMDKKIMKDGLVVCEVFALSSTQHLREVCGQYQQAHGKSLRRTIEKEFSGHMRDTLLYILDGAIDKVDRDAELLEKSMKGVGTNDTALISRLVRIHWDKNHLQQVKMKFEQKYKISLAKRIKGDTSGDYQKLLLEILESGQVPY